MIGILSAVAAGVIGSVEAFVAERQDRQGCAAVQWAFLVLSIVVLVVTVIMRLLAVLPQ